MAPAYQQQGLKLWFRPVQDWESAIRVSVAIATKPHPKRSHLTLHLEQSEFEQRFSQYAFQLLPPVELQQAIADPALKHLVNLLQAELRDPQPMNEAFVWTIVTTLLITFERSARFR